MDMKVTIPLDLIEIARATNRIPSAKCKIVFRSTNLENKNNAEVENRICNESFVACALMAMNFGLKATKAKANRECDGEKGRRNKKSPIRASVIAPARKLTRLAITIC
jgi:hypothetical protein